MSKKIDNCLILDEDIYLDESFFIKKEIININDISLVEGKFDAAISNFSLQIPLFLNSNDIFNRILSKLNDNSLLCFNTITSLYLFLFKSSINFVVSKKGPNLLYGPPKIF